MFFLITLSQKITYILLAFGRFAFKLDDLQFAGILAYSSRQNWAICPFLD